MHILPFGERYCFRPGPIPPALGNLRSLSLLFLDRNQLSGERCWWGGVRDIYIYIPCLPWLLKVCSTFRSGRVGRQERRYHVVPRGGDGHEFRLLEAALDMHA